MHWTVHTIPAAVVTRLTVQNQRIWKIVPLPVDQFNKAHVLKPQLYKHEHHNQLKQFNKRRFRLIRIYPMFRIKKGLRTFVGGVIEETRSWHGRDLSIMISALWCNGEAVIMHFYAKNCIQANWLLCDTLANRVTCELYAIVPLVFYILKICYVLNNNNNLTSV